MATLKDVITSQPDLLALAKAGNYAGVVAALEVRTLVNNPVPVAPPVAKPITKESIIGLVTDDEGWAIYTAAPKLIDHLFTAIETNNRTWLAKLLGIVSKSTKLSPATLAALGAELQEKVADPTWTAKVPGTARWQKLGLAALPSASDVQAVVNGVA